MKKAKGDAIYLPYDIKAENLGKKIKILKIGGEEEYQVLGNFIHPYQCLASYYNPYTDLPTPLPAFQQIPQIPVVPSPRGAHRHLARGCKIFDLREAHRNFFFVHPL